MASRSTEKWGLSYNDSKSKIMVVGRRFFYRERRWKLGRLLLSEAKIYKDLGVSISRTLKESHRIKTSYGERKGS